MRRSIAVAALGLVLLVPAAASARLTFVRELRAPLKDAWGVAVGPNGMIYVADPGGQQIVAFNQNGGGSVIATGMKGTKPLYYPSAVAVDPDSGNVYVADTSNSRIVELDANGGFIREFGDMGMGALNNPLGIDAADGRGFVADSRNNRVAIFTSDGTYLNQFGGFGTADGKFNVPAGIAKSTKAEIIYTTEEQTSRVQRFTADTNTFVGSFGTPPGNDDGHLNFPEDIAVDPTDGSVYVVSAGDTSGNLQHFSPVGAFIERVHGTATPAGSFTGHGVAVDKDGFVYVADAENNRIVEFTQRDVRAPIPHVFLPGRTVYRNGVKVPVKCDEDCNVKMDGAVDAGGGTAAVYRFKTVKKSLKAGEKVTLRMRLPAKADRAVKTALARHKKVRATITGTVSDAAGNKRTIKKKVTLK